MAAKTQTTLCGAHVPGHGASQSTIYAQLCMRGHGSKNQMPRCQQSPSILVQTRCGQVCLAVLSQVERKRIPFFCLCRPACAHYMYIYIYIYIYTYSICECVFTSHIHICKNMWFSVYCLLAQVPPNAAVSTTLRSICEV